MELLVIISVVFYLLIAHRLFKVWLKFFQQDTNMSLEEKQISWGVLLMGTVLWPIVVPIAYLSMLEKKLEFQ